MAVQSDIKDPISSRKWIAIHMRELMVHYKSRVNWQLVGMITLDSLYKDGRVSDEDYEYFESLLQNRRFHDDYYQLAGNDAGQIVVFEA